jgi:UDP-N-acetyl-D-mannosaminuronate dehydrogenase
MKSSTTIGAQELTRIGCSKVVVIGLGQLGLPVAQYIKEKRGFDVYGYDINIKAIDRAEKVAGIKRVVNELNNFDFTEFDVFILCVSTHKADDMFSPQIDGLLQKEHQRKYLILSIIECI